MSHRSALQGRAANERQNGRITAGPQAVSGSLGAMVEFALIALSCALVGVVFLVLASGLCEHRVRII